MKELNDLESKLVECNRYGYCAKELSAVAEAFRAIEQRAEAAEEALAEEKRITSKLIQDRAVMARECNAFEEKLAELQKQEPIAWLFEDELPENYPYEAMFPYSKVDVVRMFPVFGPAPAINLAELVPDEVARGNEDVFDVGFANGFNACRAATLRKIDEQ